MLGALRCTPREMCNTDGMARDRRTQMRPDWPHIVMPDGRLVPVIAGGSDGAAGGDVGSSGDGAGDATGAGGSSHGDGGSGSAPAAAGTPEGTTPDAQTQADANDPAKRVATLEAELQRARQEAAERRVKLGEATQQSEAITAALTDVAKALGIVPDDGDQPDPQALQSEVGTLQTSNRVLSIELAAFKSAMKQGGDPLALTDSRSFLDAISKLDPTADDFSTALDAAVKEAVEQNPKLRANGQAPVRSGGTDPGRPGDGGQRPSLNEALTAALVTGKR